MRELVTSFETSMAIAEFRDDRTMLAWVETEADTYLTYYEAALHARQIRMCAAYTLEEVLNTLPALVGWWVCPVKWQGKKQIQAAVGPGSDNVYVIAPTASEAAGKLALRLWELNHPAPTKSTETHKP